MEQIIDMVLSTEIPITIESNRDLNQQYQALVYTASTYLGFFNFAPYTGATLEVRTRYNDFSYVLRLTTEDGSITLGTDGLLRFTKPASALKVRSGEYLYDMYLRGNGYAKRGFLRGDFTILDTVTK